jgi:hypothetical protein
VLLRSVASAGVDEASFEGAQAKVLRHDPAQNAYTVIARSNAGSSAAPLTLPRRCLKPVGPLVTLAELEAKRAAVRAQVEAARAARGANLEVSSSENAPAAGATKENRPLKIDSRFTAFRIDRKPDERNDANFPPHLHGACQLFCMTGNLAQAVQVKTDVDAFLKILERGPDGKSSHRMGRACVCWKCGHVGIPNNGDKCGKIGDQSVAGVCGKCGLDEQTNFVRLEHGGNVVPWMQIVGRASADAVAAAAAAERGDHGAASKNVGRAKKGKRGKKKKGKR